MTGEFWHIEAFCFSSCKSYDNDDGIRMNIAQMLTL